MWRIGALQEYCAPALANMAESDLSSLAAKAWVPFDGGATMRQQAASDFFAETTMNTTLRRQGSSSQDLMATTSLFATQRMGSTFQASLRCGAQSLLQQHTSLQWMDLPLVRSAGTPHQSARCTHPRFDAWCRGLRGVSLHGTRQDEENGEAG